MPQCLDRAGVERRVEAFSVPLLQNLAEDPLVKSQSPLLVVLGVVLGTLLVGMLACVAPTLRELRIQPMEALKDL